MLSLLLSAFVREHLLLAVIIILLPFPLRAVEGYFRRWRISEAGGCQEPASKVAVKDPIVGFDFLYNVLFGKAPERYLDSTWKAFREMGTTYTEKRWTWEAVYTCDPLNLRQILATGCQDFDLPEFRTSVIGHLFGNGIFVLSGHSWKHARTVLRKSLKKEDPAPFLATLEQHFQAFKKHVPTDGAEIDLQPLFLALAMDVSTEFLMGHSTHMLDMSGDHTKEQQFVDDYMICSEEIIHQMQLGPLHPFKVNFAARKAKKRVYKYVGDFIDASLQDSEGSTRGNLLLDMMEMAKDRKGVCDQILHILLASRDTTSSLMSNLFFMLAKNPHMYNKLRQDVLRVAGEGPPTASQLKDMTYLKWCVNESLRLHPVIPTNARVALRDTTLPRGGGPDGQSPLFVSKGSAMFYNVYAMHRDEATFGPDPDEFVPERWEGLRPGWGYLPFNGGARSCVGQQYALLETHYVVARMVQTFKTMQSRDDEEWMELYALALCSKNGTRVAVTA
ncbi:cytochrome P450 [Thelonectria olida]|uniref:Cytochrome P450 n=1 Tax=Thelonectria olida TaxID=1576542 RepID=A0A9P9ATM5_9HYPO|nr:cytochrome P450 [Thelonectria olida]